jgi:eukaryotic-like serine/threonine-protein kinase
VAPGPGALLAKYVRRHRVALTVAAVIGGLLVAGTTVSTWQAIRATHASRSEKQQRLTAQNAQAAERDARAQAEKEKKQAQRLAYAANLNLVQVAWDRE